MRASVRLAFGCMASFPFIGQYSPAQAREFAGESEAKVFVVSAQGSLGSGRNEIQKIVNLAGGRGFFPYGLSDYELTVDTNFLYISAGS